MIVIINENILRYFVSKKKRKKKMRREKFVIRSVLQIPGRVNEDWIIIFETDPAEIVSFTTLQLPA